MIKNEEKRLYKNEIWCFGLELFECILQFSAIIQSSLKYPKQKVGKELNLVYPLLSAISLLRPVRTVIEIHGWRAAPLYPPLHDHQLASGSNANTKTCKSQNTNHRQICTWEEKCMKTQIKAMKIELYAFLTEQIKSYKVSQKRTNKNGQTWQVCQHSKVFFSKNKIDLQ